MGRIALVGGHSILGTDFAAGAGTVHVDGIAVQELDDGTLVLQRHGATGFRRADQVDHHANLAALHAAGAERVLGIGSCGSLRPDWPVGSVVAVDDYYAPQVTATSLEGRAAHRVHAFHVEWRACVVDAWHRATDTPLHDGGTYAQTTGPRFESPAEVRALASIADVVGMTLAAELIAASELGLPYAALAVVDNLANGLEPEPLSADSFFRQLADNTPRLLRDLDALLPLLRSSEAP